MRNRAVIYARLSREDENKIDGNTESRSIENQIEGLSLYAKENGFQIVDIYYDDGYSGGTMERPAIQKLLNDLKLKKFDIVLVKDISRLGRSLHRVGNLIEKVFPENNIRVISVNDKYDSETYKQNESIVLRSFLNDYYLKEFRKKCKKAREHYAHTKHLNYYPKYGYNFDKDRNEIIDEYSASIVKRIFELIGVEKLNPYQVARKLNQDGVLTRSRYATEVLGLKGLNKVPAKEWNASKIHEVVNDYEYCGHSINWVCHNKEEWILLKNTHKAIIDEDLYNLAQQAIKERSYLAKHNYERPNHIGKLIFDREFPDRNYLFSRHIDNSSPPYYFSRYSHNKIKCSILEEVVYNDIINIIQQCLENPERLYNYYKTKLFNGKEYRKDKLEDSLKLANEAYSRLIENYYNQTITELEFKKKSIKMIDVIHELENQLKDCKDNQIVIKTFDIKFKRFLEQIKNIPQNKLDVIRMAVDRIYVERCCGYNDFDITIKYKFEI